MGLLKTATEKTRDSLLGPTKNLMLRQLLLTGKQASFQVRSRDRISSLAEVEFRVFSQWGEDGIIDWLIEQVDLPASLHSFVEFGVENYQEANTLFLMQNRNWRGLVMDGNPDLLHGLSSTDLFWRYDLSVRSAFITCENINALLEEAGFEGEIGLLSVDVDGNDYWVWKAIEVVRPVFVICEYNAIFGDIAQLTVPYDPLFRRTKKHYSGLYFGASINGLIGLSSNKGYEFLGTNAAANNAFFVRKDYAKKFEGRIGCRMPCPSTLRQSRDRAGRLTYLSGLFRNRDEIGDMPVVHLITGETVSLNKIDPIYSDEWLRATSCRIA